MDCGFRISDCGFGTENLRGSLFNPQSGIRNPNCPPESDPSRCLVQAKARLKPELHASCPKKAAWIPLIHAAQRELDPVYPSQLLHYPLPLKK